MFTGIIRKTAKVISVEVRGKSRIVHVEKPKGWHVKLGQSIAVDGVCTTTRALGATYLEFEYMPETLSRTTVARLQKGSIVNLERSLRLHEVVDGHFVQGHVDTRGKVVRLRERGASREVSIRVPQSSARYIAEKGSITVNGVSLTVASVQKNVFRVALIPYSLKHTNLGMLKMGEHVNIETDLIARYLAKLRGK